MARGRANKKEKEKVNSQIDKLFDITYCNHTITLCHEPESGCPGKEKCKTTSHIQCSCLREEKIPVIELEWMYHQRAKVEENSGMKMGKVDWKESEKQDKTARNKLSKEEAKVKQVQKQNKQ